jgi:CRP/FNR family transcriptional regulator
MPLSGEVRVARGTPGGRAIELYRMWPGELCVVSTSCLFGHAMLMAHGTATMPMEMVVLSPQGLDRWTAEACFRSFVFGTVADRLADLIFHHLVQTTGFQPVTLT